ncbi:rna binding protein fox-1-like protein [Lasius niger]|uniref:Rna binding protein fox-1-like protein n=1 Tax=Lasius niger TaxID=67767 RepID=A0A0J7KAI7_LASNI|nr:rna binding protein fox-1-like protein [Lasius niger]
MAAPYGGGVFPPPVNGVAGVVGAAGAAGDVKPPPPVPVKEESAGAPQQPPPAGGPQVPPAAGAPHPAAPGAPTAASFSPPPPPNGVDQQAILSLNYAKRALAVTCPYEILMAHYATGEANLSSKRASRPFFILFSDTKRRRGRCPVT